MSVIQALATPPALDHRRSTKGASRSTLRRDASRIRTIFGAALRAGNQLVAAGRHPVARGQRDDFSRSEQDQDQDQD